MAVGARAGTKWVQSDTATASAVSVLITDTQLVAANQKRVEVTVCNDHATQVVYLSLAGASAAVASQGIRLNGAGGSYTTSAYTGQIRAISVGGTSVVTVSEVTR